MRVEVEVVNAFSCGGQGGNPAGVVLAAEGLSSDAMQAVAARMALSETAFVSALGGRDGAPGAAAADFEMRFFTPRVEIDYCGHATLASFYLLARRGRLAGFGGRALIQQTRAGRLRIEVGNASQGGPIAMAQPLPVFGALLGESGRAKLASLLGLAPGELAAGLPVQSVSTGLADLLVPVANAAALARLRPDFSGLALFNEATATIGVHAFALTPTGTADAVCRNFAPRVGIDEESATGSATGALACYLSRYLGTATAREHYVFEQGHRFGAPSRLTAELERAAGEIAGVMVGGEATWIRTESVVL